MRYLFNLLKLAKQYRKMWWSYFCTEQHCNKESNDRVFALLEDKEHELLECIITKGKAQ